jgi:hypothetical protein
MNKAVHKIYIFILFVVAMGATIIVGIRGCDFYSTSQKHRGNFEAEIDTRLSEKKVDLELAQQGLSSGEKSVDQIKKEIDELGKSSGYIDDWKPEGRIGHGLGIVGSAMMIGGVIMYSSRKRVKALRYLGKLKHWLEFHIFLCLLGPTLVMYHTTFKFGGLVAVSLWSMVAVVLSGVIGRYIYTQIPRNISGHELSAGDLQKENDEYSEMLRTTYQLDNRALEMIDGLGVKLDAGSKDFRALVAIILDDFAKRTRVSALKSHLRKQNISHEHIKGILAIAKKKSLLVRRMAFLGTAQRLFHYWHVIHQPFSIIMFVILAIHVGVTVALGYRWIF